MRDRIICGDTLDFVTTFAGYPAATWTCTYYFIPRTAGPGAAFSVVCTAGTEANEHRCAAAATTTGAWTPAEYSWSARMASGAEVYEVDRGTVTLLPNLALATAYDGRSTARQALDAVEAIIANRATLDQMEYTIGNRSLKRMTPSELYVLRSNLRVDVIREEQRDRASKGLPDLRRIYLRAGNA